MVTRCEEEEEEDVVEELECETYGRKQSGCRV
jgi:hypothetical protein